MQKTKALITGGAGFIGSHLADALASRGYAVRILDSLTAPVHDGEWPRYVMRKGYELVRGDVRDKDVLGKALAGVSCVFHFAAYQDQRLDFSTFFSVNTVSTALLYELIVEKNLPVRKVVVASSQFAYGDGKYECAHKRGSFFYPELRTLAKLEKKEWDIMCPHGKPARFLPFTEGQHLMPTNSYGLSKVALEQTALRLGKTYGIPTVALRYSITQGARQSPRNLYSGALRIFVTAALKGDPLVVYEDGMQKRDFVNVHDVVAAILAVTDAPEADYEAFNVGGGKGYTVIGFAKTVKKITGSSSPIVIRGEFRRTDTRHAVSDIKKLKKLGWVPKSSPEESVRQYADWLTKEYKE